MIKDMEKVPMSGEKVLNIQAVGKMIEWKEKVFLPNHQVKRGSNRKLLAHSKTIIFTRTNNLLIHLYQ